MAETLSLISLVSFIGAAVSLVVTVILFFWFQIPSVIGDLTGRTARRSIVQTRKNNEKNGSAESRKRKVPRYSKSMRKEDAAKTELLKENEITLPSDEQESGTSPLDVYETAPLGAQGESYETAPLGAQEDSAGRSAGGIAIEILEEIMLIHSDETLR